MSASIMEKAMKVRLSISRPPFQVEDRSAAKVVQGTFNATAESGKYIKLLIVKNEYAAITTISNAARMYHLNQTLPWENDGWRILMSSIFMEYMNVMQSFHGKFDMAVGEFMLRYPMIKLDARNILGDLYDESQFPAIDDLRGDPVRGIPGKFMFTVSVNPIENANDFRVKFSDDDAAAVKSEIEKRINANTEAAMRDVWERLYAVVAKMARTLSNPDKTFKDTLIGNAISLLDILPHLNLTEDQNLVAMAREIESKLCIFDPKELRRDDKERKMAADAAADIMSVMGSYMGGK